MRSIALVSNIAYTGSVRNKPNSCCRYRYMAWWHELIHTLQGELAVNQQTTVFDITKDFGISGRLLCVMANSELDRRLGWLCPDFDRCSTDFKLYEEKYRMGTFINISLTREQIEDLQVWLKQNNDDLEFMEALLAKDGYRASLKWNPKTESFVYTVMRREMKYGDDGEILSRHGSELWKARAEALFIHFELTKGNWSSLIDMNQADW